MARTRASLLAVAAVALLLPAAAHANTYCVMDPACVSGGGTPEALVQGALTAAQGNPGPDKVQIGPLTQNSNTGFTYNSSDPVTIVGAGTGLTTLSDNTAPNGTDTLNIAGSTASTVSNLALVQDASGSFGSALDTVGSASDISATGSPPGGNVIGISAGPASVLSHVTVAVELRGGSAFNEGVKTAPGTVVQDSTIQGGTGVDAEGAGAPVTLRRLTIRSDLEAVEADAGTIVSLQDSLILSVGSGAVAFEALHSMPTIDARNVTLVGPGPPGPIAMVAGDTGSINFRNSIAVGYEKTFDVDSTSNISTDYSDYLGTRNGTGTITEAHQLNVDPGFVNAAAGDYRLAAGSPLINAGDPAGPAAGDSLTDLAGNPRVSGARLDIGAYEFQFPAPPVVKDTTAPSLSAVSMTNKVFAVGRGATPISATRIRFKVGTTIRYTLSEPATVKLVFAQKLTGRRVGKRCVRPSRKNRHRKRCTRFVKKGTLTRSGKAGANSVKFSGRVGRRALKPGRYRVTITATDASGNKSKPKTLSFRIVRPAHGAPKG